MRKAVNENPLVQIVLVGVLVIATGLMLVTRLGGSKSSDTATPPAASSAAPGLTPAPTGDPTLATPAPATPQAALSTPTSVDPQALVPGPGLPQDVIVSWARGDAVVLLIVRGGGIDDRLVKRSVSALSGDPNLTTIVVRAKDVARYSRITTGVGLNRVPALIVIRPQEVSGSTPQALVSYGFRSSQSVVVAVRDAVYNGKDGLPYHPG
jgi:hypothetical protein